MSKMLNKLKQLLDIPPAIMAGFTSSPNSGPRQTLITITSEIKLHGGNIEDLLDDLDAQIESDLGNPAKGKFKDALDETGIIHFASLSIIRGAKDAPHEPSYLFLEMSADGTEVEILETLCESIGQFLRPIYEQANCLKKNESFLKHMKHNSVHLVQTSWPGFFAGHLRNGLGFSGTPGLSVEQIISDDDLVEKVRDKVEKVEKVEKLDFGHSPVQIIETVKEQLLADGETLPLREPPLFAEDKNSPWLKKSSLLKMFIDVFPPIYYAYILLSFLTTASVLWLVLYGGAGKPCGFDSIPSIFSVSPDDLPTLKLFLSVSNLFWGLFLAFLGAIFLKIIAEKFKFVRLQRLGGVIWYLVIAYVMLALWRFSDLFAGAKKGVLPSWGTISIWVYVAGLTLLIILLSKLLKHFSKIARPATWVALFLMFLLFTEIGQTHWQLFNLPTWDGGGTGLYNRWDNATFPQMFFYPLLYAVLLLTSVIAVDAATPGLGTWMKYKIPQISMAQNLSRAKVYVFLYICLHFLIYFSAFFSVEDAKLAWANKYWILKSWVLLPVCISVFAVTVYFWLNKFLKKTRRKYFQYVLVLAVVLVVLINFQHSNFLDEIFHLPKEFHVTWGNEAVSRLLLSLAIAIPVTLLILALITGLLLLLLRNSEKNNTPSQRQASPDKVRDLMSHENLNGVQNHMLVVGRLLPEQFRRRFTLPVSLNVVKKRIAKHTRPGFLGRINSVHYARWIHFPRTNNYGFFTNYDGSFESYMEDFVTKAPDGLNLVSGHTEGYPETEFMIKKGAADGDAFKSFLRARFIAAPMWYSAYPAIPAEQIRRNALIVQGLTAITATSDAESWLALFASMPRPQHALETHEIQSLVFGNAKHLRAGCCISIICPNPTKDEFRAWVDNIRKDITFGDQPPKKKALYLAFSNTGLEMLGVTDSQEVASSQKDWEDFNPQGTRIQKMNAAFSVGMDDPTRVKVLADDGDNAPEKWDWGSGDNTAHAVLFVYIKVEDKEDPQKKIEEAIKEHKNTLETFGLEIGHVSLFQPTDPKGENKEPFGFVDGLSQPILRGTRQADANPDSIHLIEPGEIILGYKDNRGYFPKSPILHAALDPNNILPSTPTRLPRRYPKFEFDNPDLVRDFGRNGSFLIIRQLEQDYKGFKEETDKIANCVSKNFRNNEKLSGDGLRAKLMGRWQNGSSLIKYPMKLKNSNAGRSFIYPDLVNPDPDLGADNEFLFGRDDPQGHACPFGSHIRRANPRDGLDPLDKDSMSISNRHRILRRGRSYYQSEKGKDDRYPKKGTFFIALNANIERQFEFVQQTWVGSTKFHGLRDEKDPIASNDTTGSFTIQAPSRGLEIQGLSAYVTMKGGGYFFMPGRAALKYISSDNG